MSNVVDLLTSLLEQVTPSKNHTSDQWSNLISELKNNLKESRASITNATDPLTESLSTILSALQSSRSSGSSESSTDENKPEASQSRQEYTKKTKTTHKSEGEQSGSAGKEREHLPESELHNTQKRKYSLTSVFKTFFGKGKIGESRDGDHSNEDTSASEGAGKIIMGLERKTKPLKKAMKRLRTSSLSNYTKELYSFGSLSLPKRGEADVPWEYRDENAMEEVSGRVPPLNFKLLMPHEHVTTPESSVNSPGSSFKKAKTETAADKEFDIAKIISAISSRGHSNVVEDEDDNKIGTEGTSGIDDAIEVDYNVAGTEGSMLLYENNREVGEGVSAEGVVGAIEGVGVAPDSVALSTTDVAKKHVPEVVGDGVAAGTSGGEGASVGDGGSGAQKDGDGDRYGLIVGVGDRGVVALNEGSTGTTAIAETVATNLPGLEIKYDSKVEATPAGTASGGPVADAKKQREFKECPREFINKMRESKEHVYTPLKEINNSTNKVNLYLVATEMIKSKLFIFKRKMYVFNYNAVDPSVYFNQSYVNPEVDYSIQILAPIDGVHHHINFGDILRLKRVDAHVKHEKGKKYVNILIPDKCNPTVRAWRFNSLDDGSLSSNGRPVTSGNSSLPSTDNFSSSGNSNSSGSIGGGNIVTSTGNGNSNVTAGTGNSRGNNNSISGSPSASGTTNAGTSGTTNVISHGTTRSDGTSNIGGSSSSNTSSSSRSGSSSSSNTSSSSRSGSSSSSSNGTGSGSSVTLVGARPMGEVADNAEVAEGNETLSVGGESHTSCSDDVVLVEERLVIDGNMANVRRRSGDRREFEDNYVGNSSNTNEYSDANTSSSIREDSGSGDITGTSDGITDNTGANSGDLGTSEVSVDGTDSATTAISTTNSTSASTTATNTATNTTTTNANVAPNTTSTTTTDSVTTTNTATNTNANVAATTTNTVTTTSAAVATTANAAAPTNTANTGGSSTGSTTSVNTCSTTEVTHAGAKDVDSDNFELWKRNAITVIGSDKLSYTMKDYNILMYMKEYAKRLDPVKVFRRPDLLRKLSEANSENLDFIVKVHNVSKDYTFIVSDATAKALVVELDPMLIENVFRSYNPVKKGDWIKLRSFYKAEGCSSLTLRPSSFACITRLPPMSQKVVGDEQARSSEKNVNRANSSKVNGLSGSKKENGRTRTVNLEVWTRTSCLNNSFPKRIKKSQSFIEKLLSTQHTVTFQKASPEPEKVEKEEGEISQ